MSSNIASVHVVGNVVKDPETIFQTEDNERVLVTIRVAVNNRYLAHDGEWKDGETTYVEVQCWNKLANNVSQTLRKGMPVIVIGRLVQSNWEEKKPDGTSQKRSILRIKATHVGPDLNFRVARTVKPPTAKDEEQGLVEPPADAPGLAARAGERSDAETGFGSGTGVGEGAPEEPPARDRELVGAGVEEPAPF